MAGDAALDRTGHAEMVDEAAPAGRLEFARDVPALAASLVLHVVILLWLALAGVSLPEPARVPVTVIETVPEPEEVDLDPQEMVVADTAEETGAAGDDASADVAQALAGIAAAAP